MTSDLLDPMKLYLVQHGDAVANEVDPDRPLSRKGNVDIERLAGYLSQQDFAPARILHSGKTRARQTAEILAARLIPATAVEAIEGLAPKDPVEPWTEQIDGWQEDTMLVGHQPFMGRLVSMLLATGTDTPPVAFRPGCMVCLQRDPQAAWQLYWMLGPELTTARG